MQGITGINGSGLHKSTITNTDVWYAIHFELNNVTKQCLEFNKMFSRIFYDEHACFCTSWDFWRNVGTVQTNL